MDEVEEARTTEPLILGPLPPAAFEPAPNVTLNAHVDQRSVHLHEAMSLPDAEAAERLQKLYPDFMKDVMDGRRKEQRFRHVYERRAQDNEAALIELQSKQRHEMMMQDRTLAHQRFNSAVALMGLVGVIFAIITGIALLKGWYMSSVGLGLGMAYSFGMVVKLLRASTK